jgi:DNA-binding transcriptional LysR family regulator
MKTVDPMYGVAAFLAVADRQSFTGGAERLGLTRATVSAQVAELEARLGVRLLHRSTRAVRLTPAGQAFRERLADLPERMAVAERAAQAEHSAPEGRLRITAPPDLCQRFLVPWVAEFLALHPGITVELDLSNAARNLIADRFDLAIRGVIAVEPNLITRKLGESPLMTVASPGYLAARGAPGVPTDLTGHDLLHFSHLRRGRVWTMARGEERVEVPVAPRMELSDGWALRTAALEGAGIAQLLAFVVGEDVRQGRLVAVLGDWSPGVVPLHAVYPDNRLVASRVRAFVAFLAKKARGTPDL